MLLPMRYRQAVVGQDAVDASRCDVVITTRNRPEPLANCLRGLQDQSVQGFGVIVVDDASDVPIASSLDPVEPLAVTVATLPAPSGPAAGRNAGVDRSEAELIIFIDDDVVPNHRFVEAHIAAVTGDGDDGAPVVSCGPFVQPGDWDPTPWNLWEARQAKKEADNLMMGSYRVSWRQFHTGNNCLPRAVFEAVGGFDESFKRAEDDELGLRLHRHGCRFHFEPEAIAWHYSNRTLEAWLAIPRAYAHYDVVMDRQYPDLRWLERKVAEHDARRLPLRLIRRALGGPRRTALGVRGAVALGQLTYRVGMTDLSMAAFSAAYDLSYSDALRADLSAAES
jgi:GT2 family glycosyltransferase